MHRTTSNKAYNVWNEIMSTDYQANPNDGGATTAYVEAGGQIFPLAARDKVKSRTRKQPIRGADTREQLVDTIRREFHSRFIMDLDGAQYPDNDTLLEDYRYDIGLVRRACGDVCDMLKLLYRANTRFDFQADDDANQVASETEAMDDAHYRNWSEQLSRDVTIGDYGLSTRLTTLLQEEGPQSLVEKRDECLTDFIAQLDRLLAEMVESQLAGLVVFGKDKDCDFHFFCDTVIEYKQNRQTMRQEESRRTLAAFGLARVTEISGTQFDTTKHETHVRRTRQDNYLRNVSISEFGKSRETIPANIHDFLVALPSWLQNSIRIVEGDRYSQQFFNYQIEHKWEETVVRPFHSVIVEETICDPAITLGHYVLTGWDDTDVDQQSKIQEDEWRKKQGETIAGMAGTHSRSMLMAAAISLIVTMLGFCLLSGGASQLVGAIGATAFTACGLSWFRSGAEARQKRTNGVHYLLAGAGCVVFMVSLLTATQAVRVGNWGLSWVILFVPMALYGVWALREILPED